MKKLLYWNPLFVLLLNLRYYMDCSYCNHEVPDHGFFCGNCAKQLRCKSCNELLEKNAKACIYCGDKLNKSSDSNNSLNKIEFKESKDERTFKATFTDTIGENISASFSNFLKNSIESPKKLQIAEKNDAKVYSDIEEIESEEEVLEETEKPIPKEDDTHVKLNRIFKISSDNEYSLIEHRLKADTHKDFGSRIILLFLLSRELKGLATTRKDITFILTKSSSNTSTVRNYVSNNTDMIKEKDNYSLSISGREKAKVILEEVFNDDVTSNWDVSKIKSSGSRKSSPTKTYKVIELGLSEEQRQDLRDFYNRKSPNHQNEKILVIMYWLKENAEIEEFNVDEIYTSFNILGERSPKSIESVFNNTRKEGKLSRLENGNCEINHIGSDFVKFTLPKNQE